MRGAFRASICGTGFNCVHAYDKLLYKPITRERKNMPENMKTEIETINKLAQVVRQRYENNAVEALIGVLSTVCTAKQLEVLCEAWSAND